MSHGNVMDTPISQGSYTQQLIDRFGEKIDLGGEVEEIPLLHQVLTRRTHRAYDTKPIPEPLLRLLTLTALAASSKSDFQQASIIRVCDQQKRKALADLIPSMPWIGDAPIFLVFCGDARRLERIGQLRGHPERNGRLEGFFNAAVDAALVMQTFILTAEASGLGCCPISVIRNHIDRTVEILSLPDLVFPVAGLCVGYPAAAGHLSPRLSPSITLHMDRYDDSMLPENLDVYDRVRNSRHAIPRMQQRNLDKFGYAEFYGWSEDKARQAAQAEGAAFPPFLRRHGFTFD